jgi:hypothetical protein
MCCFQLISNLEIYQVAATDGVYDLIAPQHFVTSNRSSTKSRLGHFWRARTEWHRRLNSELARLIWRLALPFVSVSRGVVPSGLDGSTRKVSAVVTTTCRRQSSAGCHGRASTERPKWPIIASVVAPRGASSLADIPGGRRASWAAAKATGSFYGPPPVRQAQSHRGRSRGPGAVLYLRVEVVLHQR